MSASTAPALFTAATWRAVELHAADEPRLQRFFDANPEYFVAVGGAPAAATEAKEEMHGALPAGFAYTKKWILGFEDDAGELAAMANVVSDLFAKDVWHIGLFIVATTLHGRGAARTLNAALEGWMRGHGAQWLRLGVVAGNARGERFWERNGYVETRTRDGIEIGRRVNTVRVMAKPLGRGTLAEYLALVPRDRPDPVAPA